VSQDIERGPSAFYLGLDIEEVYVIFGEGLQFGLGGLSPSHYDQIERKTQRVRDALLDFGCPVALVQRFETVASRVYRAGDPRGADLARLGDESAQTAQMLSALMHEVPDHLGVDDAALYNLGVMVVRLHLCLRVLIPNEGIEEPPPVRELYKAELRRIVPIVRDFLAAAEQAVTRTGSEQLSARLRSLAGQIEAWDGGSERWCQAARQRVDRVFAAVGALPRRPLEPPSAPDDELSPEELEALVDAGVRAFEEARQHAQQLWSADDFVAAEQAQRALIEESRRRFGFNNPFTVSVRGDLAVTLVALERGDLAADLVYDLADDVERTFGQRHPTTAATHVHVLFILIATRSFDEVIRFRLSRLGWLREADPATLDPELAEIQRDLFELTGQPRRGQRRRWRFTGQWRRGRRRRWRYI
jgi:hypothetical protein